MAESSPVQRYRVSTDDPGAASEYMQGFARLRVDRPQGEGFEFALAATAVDSFGVSRVRHTARFRGGAEPPGVFTVGETFDGDMSLDGHGAEGDARLMVAPHWTSYDFDWTGGDQRITTIDLAALSGSGAERSGVDGVPVSFGGVRARSAALARYWTSLVDRVERDVLADDEPAAVPLVRGEARRALVTAALMVFPNSTIDHPHTTRRDTGEPATVRRAVEFMDTHAGESMTISDIAGAARIGPRGLQAAFQRHREEPPLQYLRRARMERAHRDLQAGDPTRGDTVAGIAARWGFTHPGRFSVEYRHAHGCSPSETLRG